MIAAQPSPMETINAPLDAWRAPKVMHPARWTERNVYLDSRITSTPGYYNFDEFPYLHAVFDAVLNPAVEKIILSWGTQLGKSTFCSSILGWIGENAPGPAMIGVANESAGKAHYKRLLEPSLERIPSIRRRMPTKTRRRWQVVDLGSMLIFYGWPGSPATISDRPIRYLIVNEASLWPGAKGSEGDPVQMTFDRTKAFPFPAKHARKIIVEGKPTIEGECRLTTMMEASRKYECHVPCPTCGRYQRLYKGKSSDKGGIKWKCDYESPSAAEQAAKSVYWECEECGAHHTEEVKPAVLMRCLWIADGQRIEKGGKIVGEAKKDEREVGFHLNSAYSTIVSWGDLAHGWVKARAEPDKLQAFVNGWLAETWKRQKRKIDRDEIKRHAEVYTLGTVPDECIALAMTIDVQQDSFWYVVRAWSWLSTSWLVTYGIAQSWEQVDEIRESTWEGKGGELHKLWLTVADSGDGTRQNEVLDWCAGRRDQAVAVRGEHQYQQLAMVRPATAMPQNVPVWHIDAGKIRDEFYDVRLRKRNDEPGGWMFPETVGPDYLRGLAAWERRDKKVGGDLKKRWVSNSKAFEHFADCELMQEAVAFVYQLRNRRRPEPAPAEVRDPANPGARAYIVTQRKV